VDVFSPTPAEGRWFNEDDNALRTWCSDYEAWASSRDQPFDLEALRERMWKIAAPGLLIPAGEIMAEFHLARGNQLRAIGYVVGIVSEHNRRILGHSDVFLESIVIRKSTGYPLSGYFEGSKPNQAEIYDLTVDRKRTQDYCRAHPFVHDR
jgi:hypothetical protein